MMRLNRDSYQFGGGLVTNYVENIKNICHSYQSAIILNTVLSHEGDKCFNNA